MFEDKDDKKTPIPPKPIPPTPTKPNPTTRDGNKSENPPKNSNDPKPKG